MIVEHTTNRKFRRWTCGTCDKLLGLIYKNGTVSVKYKDLVLWVTGSIKTVCRSCQTENTYTYEKNVESLFEQ